MSRENSKNTNNKGNDKKAPKANLAKKGSAKKPSLSERWKELDKWRKAIIIALIVLLLVIIAAVISIVSVYSGFRTNIDKNNLGISDDIYNNFGDTDVLNVAVFGLDTRDENSFKGRSDSIIIVSLNPKEKTVKLTSILRDSYVAIDGYKNQKITHAYAFGGAELAIKTLNKNFHLNIEDYATINFYKLAEAIDVLGGVDVTITESEMYQINDIGDDEGKIIEQVTEYGDVHLNGDQAAVFVRLRKYDSDIARSNRQKMVINALLEKARQVKPSEYSRVVKAIMSLCETSLSFSEVMSLVPLINEDIQIQTLTIPNEEEAIGGIYEGAWVWRYDLNKASEKIFEFIYGKSPTFSYDSNELFTQQSSNKIDHNDYFHDEDDTYEGVIVEPNTEPYTEPETTAPINDTTQVDNTGPEENTTDSEITTAPDVQEPTTEGQTNPFTEPAVTEANADKNDTPPNNTEADTAHKGNVTQKVIR